MKFLHSRQFYIIGGSITAGVLIIALIVWISIHGYWPVARDISIIALAIISAIPLLAISYAVFQVSRTIAALRKALPSILADVKDTTKTVSDTVKSTSDFTVKPTVRAAGFLVASAQVISTLLGEGKAAKRRKSKSKSSANNTMRSQPDTMADVSEVEMQQTSLKLPIVKGLRNETLDS